MNTNHDKKAAGGAILSAGEIWFVNFDPTFGAEIKKTRPALILQNDIANLHSSITIVAAITSQWGAFLYPTEILVQAGGSGLEKVSIVLLNQIRTIDKRRLIKHLGRADPKTLLEVNRALQISLGIVEI